MAKKNTKKGFRPEEEEEEEKQESPEPASEPAEPAPAEPAAEAELDPIKPVPAPKQEEPAQMATVAPEVGAPSPKGLPKLNKQQRFEVGQNIAVRDTAASLIEAGELDLLPENLQGRKEEFENQNAEGRLGHAATKQWSSQGNTIDVNPRNIKDVTQLAYFGTTLTDDGQRTELYKVWAELNKMDLDDLYYQAETLLGDRAFDQPKSNKGKLKQSGLYDINGEALDVDTMTASQAIQAMHLMPKNHPYRESAELAVRKMFGLSKDVDLDFIESGDLTDADYNAEVKDMRSRFSRSDGFTDANYEAYCDLLDYIEADYENPRVRKQMLDTAAYVYGEITGVKAPDIDALRGMGAQAEADGTPAVGSVDENGKPVGFFRNLYNTAKDAVVGVFSRDAEEFFPVEVEPEDIIPESAAGGSKVRLSSGGGSSASSYAAAAPVFEELDVSGAVEAAQEAAAQGMAAAEVQGPTYQPQAAKPEQETDYRNHIAYNADMTDEQALLAYMGGGVLDERNAAQISRFTGNKNAMGLINGVGMYGELGTDAETGERTVIDKYNHYGLNIGGASIALTSGNLPNDIWANTALGLMDVVEQIDEIVADPRNGIVVPAGKNQYDYVLGMPEYENLMSQVQSYKGVQAQVNEINAEQALNEQRAREEQLESDRKAMLSGNGTPEAAARLAAYYDNTERLDSVRDDTLRLQYRTQLGKNSAYWGKNGTFWDGDSAAAKEGAAIRDINGLSDKAFKTFRNELGKETQNVIDEYTTAAHRVGMTLEQYLGSAGIDSVDQLVDIAYNGMLAKGNAYANDKEAQAAAAELATTDTGFLGSIWKGLKTIGTGLVHGAASTAESAAETVEMAVDVSDENTTKFDIQNQYMQQYGDQAAAMYYADLMELLDSGTLSEEAAGELQRRIKESRNIFDVAYEFDPTGILENVTRLTSETLSDEVEKLEAVAVQLPENYRTLFDIASGAGATVAGMLTVVAGTALTGGSALAGSAIAFGLPAFSDNFYANREKGMSRGSSGWLALGNAAISTATNLGGAGTQSDIWTGNAAYQIFKQAATGKGGKNLIKGVADLAIKSGLEEAGEEVAEYIANGVFDLADAAVLAYENGEAYSFPMVMRHALESLEETDFSAVTKELIQNAGFGFAFGSVFTLAGAAKTGAAVNKGTAMQKNYASLDLAAQIADGNVPFTEENVGKVLAAAKKDIQDPRYRKFLDSKNIMAREQNATLTAMLQDTGAENRRLAVQSAENARQHAEKAQAAKDASITASTRWWELRDRLSAGDLSVEVELESARMQWQKAETALQEANGAAEKAQEKAVQHMTAWLTECKKKGKIIAAREMERQIDEIASVRMEAAMLLSDIYNNQAQNEAAAESEVSYAENAVFGEEPDMDAESEQTDEFDAMTDDELDAEIARLGPQISGAEQRIADVTAQSEELGLTGESIQAMVEQELAPLSRRKDRIIARETGRFNDSFNRIQQALEMDDEEAADQLQTEYDSIGARLRTLGVDTDALTMQQYGIAPEEANAAYAAAQEQEAQRVEDEKYGKLTDSLSRRMEDTSAKLEALAPARRYLTNRQIYVNPTQAAGILAAEDLKSISQFNRRYGTKLTTKEADGAMPLDGYVLTDISDEAAGAVDVNGDPVAEVLRVMRSGKELVATQRTEKAEARELRETKKAADKQRRSKVDALAKPIQTEADAAAANSAANSAIEVTLSHTAKQQRNILAFQKAVDNDVLKAAQAFRQDPNSGNVRVPISKVGDREANAIKNLTGINTNGYTHTADRNFFKHVERRHGVNGEADKSMSLLQDVARVGWVIENYDSIELSKDSQGNVRTSTGYIDKNGNPEPMIVYTKNLDGSVYVVEAVGESKWKKLWLVSAYIQKNGPANQSQNQAVTQTPHAVTGLEPDVRNANASPAKNSLAQGSGTVNNNPNIDAVAAGGTAQTPAQKQAQRSKKLEGSALKAVQNLAKEMKVGLRVKSRQRFNSADARMGKGVLGYYKNGQRNVVVRSADAGRVSVTGHEIGHSVQEQLGIASNPQMINSWQATFGNTNAYTPQQYDHEAFAEFFWRYLTGRDAAVAYAGDAYVDTFEQALRQKKLNKAVAKAQAQVSSYWNSEAEAKIRSRIVNAYEANTPDDTAFSRRVEIRLADDTAAAEDFQDVIRARRGEKHLSLEDNLRDTIRFNRRAAARANECLTKNMVDQDGNVIGESLKDALGDVKGKDFDLFWEYELAKHSLDRDFAKGATNQVFDEDTLSTTDRRAFVAKVESEHPEFKTANDRFQKWRRQFMDTYLVNNGFLGDPAQASLMMDALEAAYPNYVPTYRPKNKSDRRATVGGKNYQMRTATGSTEDVINPFDSFVSMVNSIVQMTADNDSRKKFADLYDRYGAPLPGETGPGVGLFANEITQDMQRVSVSTENMRERITKMLDALGTDPDVIMQIGDIIGDEKVEYHGTGRVNMNNVITVRSEDGSKRYFEVYNPELYELLANTNAANRPGILDGIAKATRMMSMLTTGSNPVFGLTNAMRDFQNSVNYGSWAASYADGAVKWLGALWDVATKGEASQEYDALGGGGWTAFDTKTKKGAEEIRGEIFKGYNTSNVGRIGKMAGRTIWKIATMEAVNEAIEKTSRLAEYKYGKHDLTTAEGRIEAFLAAQDVTTDFARRGNGQIARDLKNLVPFFNASTQGIYRNARQLSAQESDRAGIRFAKNVVNSALASALANIMLLAWMDDDEKEEFFYLSDDLKAKHMFLPNFAPDVFGDAALIRIPLDQNPVSYAVNAAVANFFWEGESENEFVIEMSAVANVIKDNLNPVGSTILDPAIAMLSNKNWYGSDIVPSYLESYDETNQYTEETPTPFVEISKGLSGVGIKVSPMMLQYMAEQYTGYIGQTIIPALPSEKNQDGIAAGLLNALVATARKRVTSDPLKSNDVVSTVYDSYDEMNAVYKAGKSKRDFEIDYFRSDLTDRERRRAINEADDLIHSGGDIYEAKKDISAGYERIDQINDRDDLTDDEKHTLIQRIRRDMVETALDVQEVMNDYNTRYKDNGIVKQFMTWLFS